jgi:Glyoxalase/Bleomycin resistance protein/Dioxygenase superfamily
MFAYPVRQVAYLVGDLWSAAQDHVALYGSGPFFVLEDLVQDVVCNGRQISLRHSSAFGQWGGQMVEFIQPETVVDPFLRELFPRPAAEASLHHIALLVDDLDQTLEHFASAGQKEVLRSPIPGTSATAVWIDTRGRYGHLTEVYESVPEMISFYDMIAKAAIDFEGIDPVRRLSM